MGAKRDFALIKHGHLLSELDDLDITSPADNSVLQYDSASGTWQDVSLSSFNSQLDHGLLLGLADDDHTQYHTDARALTWLGTRSTADLPEGSNLYFTDERAQDAVGGTLTDSTSIDFTYDSGTKSTSAAVVQSSSYSWTGNHTFTPASGNTKVHAGNLQLDVDNLELQLGASQDLRFYHNGTNSFIRNDTGSLNLQLSTNVALQLTSGTTNVAVYPGVSGGSSISVNASNASTSDFRMQQGDSNRWIFRKDGTSETGSNAGSNFGIIARADDGSSLGNCFTITRSTRRCDFTVAGAGFGNGDATLPGWCFTNDSNNGAYLIGTDRWGLTSGGTLQFEIGATYTDHKTASRKTGVISPTALSGSTDNYNPTELGSCSVMRISASGAINLTGIAAQAAGTTILLMNVGTANIITLKHDVTSTAANRFFGPNSADVALRPNGWVYIWYDGTSSRWRIMGA